MANIVGIRGRLFPAQLLSDVIAKNPKHVLVVAEYDDETVTSWSEQERRDLAYKIMNAQAALLDEIEVQGSK